MSSSPLHHANAVNVCRSFLRLLGRRCCGDPDVLVGFQIAQDLDAVIRLLLQILLRRGQDLESQRPLRASTKFDLP